MLPEEKARENIDKQLSDAGWMVVSRNEYTPLNASAVKEALMKGNTESDYLLFVDNKAIAVIEAKRKENSLGQNVAEQAERYAHSPEKWYALWFDHIIPLVYLANGDKILFKNLLTDPDGDYKEIPTMHPPKKMLQLIEKSSEYGALPNLDKRGLRDCQYQAEINLEKSFKEGNKKALAVLATGSGKTYFACLAAYRLLNYTKTKRVLFLVDRNNLARQTETEFCLFDKTEKGQPMNLLYRINRLKKNEDIEADIVISTIQKLFAVLTGKSLSDDGEDSEDEYNSLERDNNSEEIIELGNDLKIPPDYFQFIIIDECHRSIYGKWRQVLNYFKDAKILGLTATPIMEAHTFFNNNIIEQYTYQDSIVDGVNVPYRVFRIQTKITQHGGSIKVGDTIKEINKKGLESDTYVSDNEIDYHPEQLDRTVINTSQIYSVIKEYRDSIYRDLYPNRKEKWKFIPKTLIFAKDDNHANIIVEYIKGVFAEKFENNQVPDGFVQKITYTAGDSNALIRKLRTEKNFRIAVTVTLVSTGTDIKPLEVVMFMNDVKSAVLYTQMKGRGCRKINDDKLREVTPNADTKECFYIVDAVGVTEHDKTIPGIVTGDGKWVKRPTLEQLLEHLAYGVVSDDNLTFLRDYCAKIQNRYESNPLFDRHLDDFINSFGFSPRDLAKSINESFSNSILPSFSDINDDNIERKKLISCLISNVDARKKLIEMHKGYYLMAPDEDKVVYVGFSKETAKAFIETFELYLKKNSQSIEALRIVYNSEDEVITHSMLVDLEDQFISENSQYTAKTIWNNYKILDSGGKVDEFKAKSDSNTVTNLLQIARFAYHKTDKLTSLYGGYARRFNLYCGQAQRELSQEQQSVMREIAEYIVNDGAINADELNEVETDLWRQATTLFGKALPAEMMTLSRFILRTV